MILILTCLMATGCIRSLVLRGTGEDLLDQIDDIPALTKEQANLAVEVTKWGPEYKIIVGYHSPGYSSLAAAKLSGGGGSNSPIYESSWTASKYLVSALKEQGYCNVDVAPEFQIEGKHGRPDYLFIEEDPAYQIEGDQPISPGSYFGLCIVWDILMAVPSVFLPVPLVGTYTLDLNIKILDGKTGAVLSEIRETLDSSIVGFSLWGLLGGAAGFNDDIQGVAVMLINRELIRLEANKTKTIQ